VGATAKAWAADRAAARIAGELGCGALVNLGGDIAVAGVAPPGGWRVRVQDVTGRPEDPPAGPSAVIAIGSGGLATSSTAARRWRRGGDVLHHILDPRSGLPAAPVWRTVSVAAATAADATAASTAALIRREAAPARLALRPGLCRQPRPVPPPCHAPGPGSVRYLQNSGIAQQVTTAATTLSRPPVQAANRGPPSAAAAPASASPSRGPP